MKLKRFEELNESIGRSVKKYTDDDILPIDSNYNDETVDKSEKQSVKDFLFDRYKKYYPDAKSFNDIKEEMLSFRKIANLIEEYCKK